MLFHNQIENVIYLPEYRAMLVRDQKDSKMLDLTQSRLHELFTCNPERGELHWRQSGKGRRIGRPAGALDTGHRVIRVDGVTHPLQRAIWVYVNGPIPGEQRIRFEDGNPLNCAVSNLRMARTKKEADALFHQRNPDAHRRYNYAKLYQGMTISVFEAMLAEQGGVCAICKQPETTTRNGKVRELCVDHCHATDEVRGLLCVGCNTAVGYAQDDPSILRAAADYLDRHATKQKAAA